MPSTPQRPHLVPAPALRHVEPVRLPSREALAARPAALPRPQGVALPTSTRDPEVTSLRRQLAGLREELARLRA